MKDQEIGRELQMNKMDTREGKDDIVGNVAIRAISLALCQSLTRSSCSVRPVLALLKGLLL
jgi:hypothetical protein